MTDLLPIPKASRRVEYSQELEGPAARRDLDEPRGVRFYDPPVLSEPMSIALASPKKLAWNSSGKAAATAF